MTVTTVLAAPGVTDQELVRIAAGAEWGSEHPVARAIVSAHGGAAPVAESFASHAGFGVQALLEGSLVVAGRPKWVEDQWSVHLPIRFRGEAEMLEAAGGTVIAVAHDGDFLGIVAVSDTVKPTSEDEPPAHPSCFQAPVSLGSLVHRELLGYAQAQQAFFGLAAKGV